MKDIERLFEKIDSISETVTRIDTTLDTIDRRGTTASSKAIKDLDDKYSKKLFKAMGVSIIALLGVMWEFLTKKF